jgi:hypothetical protein
VSPLLKNSIKKYGKDYFYMEPLWESDNCTQKEIDDKEMELIKEHNTISPNGYNLTEGGSGGRHSAETKQLLSEICGPRKERRWLKRGAINGRMKGGPIYLLH